MKNFIFLSLLFSFYVNSAQVQVIRLGKTVKIAKELRKALDTLHAKQGLVDIQNAQRIHVAMPASYVMPKAKMQEPVQVQAKRIECPNCGDEKSADEMMQLSCGDRFCKECLADQVKNALQAKSSAALHCLNCNRELQVQEFQELANFDQEILVHDVLDLLAAEAMAKIQGFKHCPTPNCSYQFEYEAVPGQKPMPFRCPECNQIYCPECLERHDPNLTCQEAKQVVQNAKMQAKSIEEIPDFDCISCPKCNKQCLKGENCSFIKCGSEGGPYDPHNPQFGCGYKFCFGCLRQAVSTYRGEQYVEGACTHPYCVERDEAKIAKKKEEINVLQRNILYNENFLKMHPGDRWAQRYLQEDKESLVRVQQQFDQMINAWKAKKAQEREVQPKVEPKAV